MSIELVVVAIIALVLFLFLWFRFVRPFFREITHDVITHLDE